MQYYHRLRNFIRERRPAQNVSARLGHASASITAYTYAYALESVDQQAADKLDEIMKKNRQLKACSCYFIGLN